MIIRTVMLSIILISSLESLEIPIYINLSDNRTLQEQKVPVLITKYKELIINDKITNESRELFENLMNLKSSKEESYPIVINYYEIILFFM